MYPDNAVTTLATDLRDQILTRRRALGSLAAAGVAAGFAAPHVAAQDAATDEDLISVLNYALALEHLENAFYRDGLAAFTVDEFTALGFQESVLDYLTEIGNDEAAHVATLTGVITDLGGTPVAEGQYDITAAVADATAFLATAMALENTGVSAYTGAAQFLISSDALLTAALTIHGVEARHAAYLNILNEENPFPEAFDPPLSPAEVVAIASPFIVEAEVITPTGAATPVA
ncbi:MAG: ferritin-like domain-containing protein [Thermomicrobiales bacterium]